MNSLPRFRFLSAGLLSALALVQAALADPSDLLFSLTIDGDPDRPTLHVTNNSPVLEIERFEFTIGDVTRNFDGRDSGDIDSHPGGTPVMLLPNPLVFATFGTRRSDRLVVSTPDLGPGETFSIQVEIDTDGPYVSSYDPIFDHWETNEDYSTVFFNNGGGVENNSVATVYAGAASASRRLPEQPGATRTFRGPGRRLTMESRVEGFGEPVSGIVITRDGVEVASEVDTFDMEVAHGDRIQITAPQEVFKDIHSQYIADSGPGTADTAEERFLALGMSVNNVPQTADPTFYDFEITGDTDVQVKWKHYYALTVRQDLTKTRSLEEISGTPWAPGLESDASGSPDPPVSKQWVLRGTQPVIKVDGQLVDNFSHPGLDLRYVVKGYRAYGPPNSEVTPAKNADRINRNADIRDAAQGTVASYAPSGSATLIVNGSGPHGLKAGDTIEITDSGNPAYNREHLITLVNSTSFTIPVAFGGNPVAKGLWRNATYVRMFEFPSVEQRQQVKPPFTMYCPGGITYVWQIQYGVRVNTDDVTRIGLAKVWEVVPSGPPVDRTIQDGVAWFDPGSHIKVVARAEDGGPVDADDRVALTGWLNGDGHYFSSQGQVDPATNLPSSGGPETDGTGRPVADWITDGPGASLGYEITNLQRPVRVFWRYGSDAIIVNVTIGQHLFENYPGLAGIYQREPEPIIDARPDPVAISESGAAPASDLMAEWDPVSARLYPTIPGTFTVPWKPGTGDANPVEIRVVATLPFDSERRIRGHYPHIQGSPAVALDPDPNDDFSFRSVKYTTAGASVDADGLFSTTQPGLSILLFSKIASVVRGQPREFLEVRVVDTRAWDTDLPSTPTEVAVGEKILDPAVDRAGLGTGYVIDLAGRARYNPFIYDADKLEGLAARDIYDMGLLRADTSELVVVNKDALPGPVITVNEHPGVADRELPIIVWYDDPRRNDALMWPHISRIYRPAWPDAATLPQIVIASQLGSEGKSRDDRDQTTAPAIGDFPEATTYDPSRLQAVQVYQQPDFNSPGYNPNEEHALVAPSLRFADVSPRPPAIYALRAGDLNYSNRTLTSGTRRYTSHPYVLVEFYDVAADEMKMNVYTVKRQSSTGDVPAYRFATDFTASTNNLKSQPYVVMKAGEPVIPFYPLGVAIGASPAPQTFGNNFFPQETYWEDWRGSYWAISGGNRAWFNVSFYYPLGPDFWWPPTVETPPVKVTKSGATYTAEYDDSRASAVPGVGDSVAFLPADVGADISPGDISQHLPTKVIFKSEWPDNPAVLKSGETLTFSGGEYRADNPTSTLVVDGESTTVETPGLPQVLAMASAEVVFDSLNPEARPNLLPSTWTARVIQALDRRTAALAVASFPPELQPASGRTTVKQGKYIFNELPASLQKRLRYDPLSLRTVTNADGTVSQVPGVLEFFGLLNDKDIGDATLTASPPAVYVLEPNILTATERDAIIDLVDAGSTARTAWVNAVTALYTTTRNPERVPGAAGQYLTGLMRKPRFGPEGQILKDQLGNVLYQSPSTAIPMRAYGPGLALVTNGNFLDPTAGYPEESWVTVVENNDPSLGGSPITPHIIKVDRKHRYRGSVKTVLSDNVFDENIVLRSTGDFGANAEDLVFEWWYRPDDGSENVPPPDYFGPGQTNPWKLFPDPSGAAGKARYQITLKGNPNAPEALLADTWWFLRYRHKYDVASGTDWTGRQPDGRSGVNFTWAGAGNSQPFVDADLDGIPDFRAQLAQGWIKRVLDAVNPYEARIRDFEGDSPSTLASMVAQFGARYEGPVALNPAKNVIENVGLIELYETVLNRGRSLSIDLSRPVSTPAIANALQLASTRISDFYMLLGNEAYVDALDPTIGHGSDVVDGGNVSTSVHAFQNQTASMIEEELDLLRGVDDYYARPVYNRLFWNFTKGEGEAAYATNYNVTDINTDGFIDEADAMLMFPQGHGDAWGHYLTAVRNQYELLRHPYFNWVSRSESYNLQDIVIGVDFFDERKFAAAAAAKAKAGAEIVALTYRSRYVADPKAQWQGYTDSNPDRAWGVDEWSRRAGQGAYFDWVTSNALLPSQHPNTTLEGVRKVDRQSNADIAVVSANLSAVQRTVDQADRGYNPLGIIRGAQVFDIEPAFIDNTSGGDRRSHFDQILVRAIAMLEHAEAVWERANQSSQMLRQIGNSEAEFLNATFQEDLSYRNQLIAIFGKPYEGTIGPGRLYPAGYEGPDLGLYMYVPVRQINRNTVPGPAASFATFSGTDSDLSGGGLHDAFNPSTATWEAGLTWDYLAAVEDSFWETYSPTFHSASNNLTYGAGTTSGLFAVNYTDLANPKVKLTNFTNQMPVTGAGYTFQAPLSWGARGATGELQDLINQMIQQEAEIAQAIGAWDSLSGEVVRILRLLNARLNTSWGNIVADQVFSRVRIVVNDIIKVIETGIEISNSAKELTTTLTSATKDGVPLNLPTGGVAVSPGDALSMARLGIGVGGTIGLAGFNVLEDGLKIAKLIAEITFEAAENELRLAKEVSETLLQTKEWIKELEDTVGDEPVLRIAIFKEIQALRALSDQYRTKLDEGGRLVDERAAFNKRVAAQTQRNRYQDMTFRVSRNHALQTYRSTLDLAARYAYLAASAYDYETNFALTDPASPVDFYGEIIRARSLGALNRAVERLQMNYDSQRNQLGFNNAQREIGDISLRSELLRILPTGMTQPDLPANELPAPGEDSDTVWRQELQKARVPDLWQLPEFREQCRPFAAAFDGSGAPVPQPGIVLRFSSDISSGKNFFGKPLSGGDHAYSTSNFATKIFSMGVTFDGYQTDDILEDLAASPRVYFIPAGMDIMRVSRTDNPDDIRMWKVVEQSIPVPFPASDSMLDSSGYVPLLDGLNGRYGAQRKFSDFRAYPDSFEAPTIDTRLLGRSVWNTQWLLIIPGATLNADPDTGIDRFIDQVSDIKLIFDSYGQSGG